MFEATELNAQHARTEKLYRMLFGLMAVLLILPVLDDRGAVTRALGCFVSRGLPGEEPNRFCISSVRTTVNEPSPSLVASTGGSSSSGVSPSPSSSEPPSPFPPSPWPPSSPSPDPPESPSSFALSSPSSSLPCGATSTASE